MVVYNLFKGCELKLYEHIYTSYISSSHSIKANFSITIDYSPTEFKTFLLDSPLRDIIIFENSIYYHYGNCVLVNMIINVKEQKITLGIKGDWHKFRFNLPIEVINDIRQNTIDKIIGDD